MSAGPPPRRLGFRNLADAEDRARPGGHPARPERRRQDEPARGRSTWRSPALLPDPRERERSRSASRWPGPRRRAAETASGADGSCAPSIVSGDRRRLVDGSPAPAATRRPPPWRSVHARPPGAGQGPARRRGAPTSTGFVAALWPARAEPRRRYARALAQRNALLGRIRARRDARFARRLGRRARGAGVELIAIGAAAAEALARPFAGRPPSWASARTPSSPTAAQSGGATPAELAAELADARDRTSPAGSAATARTSTSSRSRRRPRRAALRLAGPAAAGAAGAALRRARRALPAGARRRCCCSTTSPRSSTPSAAGALRAAGRRRRPGPDHRDRGRAPPGGAESRPRRRADRRG